MKVERDANGWWWAECKGSHGCGYSQGPFDAADDAQDDLDEHNHNVKEK